MIRSVPYVGLKMAVIAQCEVTGNGTKGRSCDLYSKAVHVINTPFLQQTGCSEGLSLTHEVKTHFNN